MHKQKKQQNRQQVAKLRPSRGRFLIFRGRVSSPLLSKLNYPAKWEGSDIFKMTKNIYFYIGLLTSMFFMMLVSATMAQEVIINSKSVVLVQELSNIRQRSSMRFCKVNSKNQFATTCIKTNYKFHMRDSSNPEMDLIKKNNLLYVVEWVKAQPAGKYAFAGSDTVEIRNLSLSTKISSGTVIIMMPLLHQSKLKKAQTATLNRAKAVFIEKYGAIANKMKFVYLNPVNIKCGKSKVFFLGSRTCTIR